MPKRQKKPAPKKPARKRRAPAEAKAVPLPFVVRLDGKDIGRYRTIDVAKARAKTIPFMNFRVQVEDENPSGKPGERVEIAWRLTQSGWNPVGYCQVPK